MFKRPAYISILVGFLSIYFALMLLLSLRTVFLSGASDDSPKPAQPAVVEQAPVSADQTLIPVAAVPFIGLVFAIIGFVCMVNMLDGANWARWLYTVSFLLNLTCGILTFSNHLLPFLVSAIIQGVVVPCLFLPAANEFFKQPN